MCVCAQGGAVEVVARVLHSCYSWEPSVGGMGQQVQELLARREGQQLSLAGRAGVCLNPVLQTILNPSKGPPPRGLSGAGIDGWLDGDFDRLHT